METCDHTYERRLAGKRFVCINKPHPSKPDDHHFVASDDPIVVARANRLTLVPGETR